MDEAEIQYLDANKQVFSKLCRDLINNCYQKLVQRYLGDYFPARYPRAGIDYDGYLVHGLDEFKVLEAWLSDNFPSKFQNGGIGPEIASTYIFAFVELATFKSISTGAIDHPSESEMNRTIEQFYLSLQSGTVTRKTMRFICNVRVTTDDKIDFRRASLFNEKSEIHETHPQLFAEIPSSVKLRNDDFPFTFDGPHCWIASKQKTQTSAARDVDASLDEILNRYMLALSLFSGGSAWEAFQVQGSAEEYSAPFTNVESFLSQANQLNGKAETVISHSDVQGVDAICDWIESAALRTDEIIVSAMGLALQKFRNAVPIKHAFERIVDYCTVLEACLVFDSERHGFTSQLYDRCAYLLQLPDDSPKNIRKDIELLYDLRSLLVHGANISQRKFEKLLGKVGLVADLKSYSGQLGIQLEIAVYRLRDLARRAILMRLAFQNSGTGTWKLGTEIDLELLPERPELVAELNNEWHETLAIHGANKSMERVAVPKFLSLIH